MAFYNVTVSANPGTRSNDDTGALTTAVPASANHFFVASDEELRSAIRGAQDGDTIDFFANITLTANLPTLKGNVTINGHNFTLSGNHQYRGLFVESFVGPAIVQINDLTIADAKAEGGRGGQPKPGGQGGGGGAGLGGALFVDSGAHVTVSNVILEDNLAHGGHGGDAGRYGAEATSGGGGGYWPIGADGGDGNFLFSGGGGAPLGSGGVGSEFYDGGDGGFGGGGGGGTGSSLRITGGAGGFGGGGGGDDGLQAPGGFGGGSGGGGDGRYYTSGAGGGGAGLGGAIFVQEGGNLTLAGPLTISGNKVAGGDPGKGTVPMAKPGEGIGTGIFLHGNGSVTLAPGAGQTQTISDVIIDVDGAGGTGPDHGVWSITKNGAGTTILTGANAYTGGTTVSAGVLQGNTSGLQGNIINNASVVFDQTGNGTYAGTMSGTGALTKTGAGVLTLSGTNTYSGGTAISAGGLQINASSLQGNITNNASVIFDQAGDGTYAGTISGIGALTKAGAGVLTLSGTNTYSGGTTVNDGTVLFASDTNLGAAGSGINLNNGTVSAMGSFTVGHPVTITNSGGFFVGSGDKVTWGGAIGGSGTLVKSGAGDLLLTNANTYTGGTTVTQGTIDLSHVNGTTLDGLGSGAVTLNGGRLNNLIATTADLNNNIVLGAGGGIIDDGGLPYGFSINGTITGTGSLTIQGAETSFFGVTLVGAAAHTGATTIEADGVLGIGSSTVLAASSSAFRIARGGTFDLTAHDATIGSLADVAGAGGTVTGGSIGRTSLTMGSDNSSTSFSGTIEDARIVGGMSLTKIGTGTQTLSGANTYTGATTVNGGELIVNGSIASSGSLTVHAGAMVGGTGTLPSTTVNGGTLSPGVLGTAGRLTTGNVLFDQVSNFDVDLGGVGALQADQLKVVGTVTLSGASHLNVKQLAGFQPTPGAHLTIIDNDGKDAVNGTFSGLAEGASFTVDGHRYTITYKGETGNDVVLTVGADRTVSGTNRSDTFTDTAGFDTTYKASNGNDAVAGLDGNDILHGGKGDDSLDGGSGADRIHGGKGSDHIYGGTGADYVYGGGGADDIDAGSGKDHIWGGRGDDRFYFESDDTGTSKGKADTIHDFRHTDTIYLKGPAYTLDDSDKTPGDGEYTVYQQGSDWVVKYNQHDSPDTYHHIIVKGHDPHGHFDWF